MPNLMMKDIIIDSDEILYDEDENLLYDDEHLFNIILEQSKILCRLQVCEYFFPISIFTKYKIVQTICGQMKTFSIFLIVAVYIYTQYNNRQSNVMKQLFKILLFSFLFFSLPFSSVDIFGKITKRRNP